jgi:hypothetical protein
VAILWAVESADQETHPYAQALQAPQHGAPAKDPHLSADFYDIDVGVDMGFDSSESDSSEDMAILADPVRTVDVLDKNC